MNEMDSAKQSLPSSSARNKEKGLKWELNGGIVTNRGEEEFW
jgi:hypothetical protein